jgi:hypothetical protein
MKIRITLTELSSALVEQKFTPDKRLPPTGKRCSLPGNKEGARLPNLAPSSALAGAPARVVAAKP